MPVLLAPARTTLADEAEVLRGCCGSEEGKEEDKVKVTHCICGCEDAMSDVTCPEEQGSEAPASSDASFLFDACLASSPCRGPLTTVLYEQQLHFFLGSRLSQSRLLKCPT